MTSLQHTTPPADTGAAAECPPGTDATPDQIGAWLDRLVRLTRLPQPEADELRDELDAHLRERVRDLMLTGHDEPDAIHKSISELGDLAQLAQRYREATRTPRRRLFMNIAMIAVTSSALGLSAIALQQSQPESSPGALPLQAGGYRLELVPDTTDAERQSLHALGLVPEAGDPDTTVPVLADVPLVGRLFVNQTQPEGLLAESADDQELRDVFFMLAEPYGARSYTYWNDLEMADLSFDTHVEFMPFEGQSVEKALSMLSDAFGLTGVYRLDHRVQNGLMEIATRRFFDQREITLVSYDASDLLFADSPLEQSESSDTLMDLVMTLVEPDVWENNGGLASVNVAGNRLFVNAPARIHERIVWLLEELEAEGDHAAKIDMLEDVLIDSVLSAQPITVPTSVTIDTPLEHAAQPVRSEMNPEVIETLRQAVGRTEPVVTGSSVIYHTGDTNPDDLLAAVRAVVAREGGTAEPAGEGDAIVVHGNERAQHLADSILRLLLMPVEMTEPASQDPAFGLRNGRHNPMTLPHDEQKRVYVIRAGDTLSSIARAQLGSRHLASAILDANPGLESGRLVVGQELLIPADVRAPLPTDDGR